MTDHSAHQAAGIARPGAAKSNPFQVNMNKGMARMMEDMHRPGFAQSEGDEHHTAPRNSSTSRN